MYGSYLETSSDLSEDSTFTLLRRYSFSGMNFVTEHPVTQVATDTAKGIYNMFFDILRVTSFDFICKSKKKIVLLPNITPIFVR